jgi:ubiquinone/menaquinone biosynthesis C-methylase UbiE
VHRYVPPGDTVLDWGSGNGHFSYFLVRAGYTATAFTFDEALSGAWIVSDAFREVRGNPSEPVKLAFPDESFGAVVSVGVLEHVVEFGGDEAASLAEIRRVLRPGGIFLCYHLPNRWSAIEAVVRRTASSYRHTRLFDRPSIRSMLSRAGLDLVAWWRYGILPRNSLGRLPRALRLSGALNTSWNALDSALARVLNPICQNHAFVASRPD